VSSSSLKRHVNFSVLDNFVEWDEDGITATITTNVTGNALVNMIQDAGFENTFVTSSSMTKDNELLKTLGSDWRVESNNLLSMMNVQTAKDSSIYVIIVTYPKKGEPVYTDIIPMGKCGTKAYSKRTQFCDTRGTGTIYKMVTIGTQTWMAENLNYPTSSGSACYKGESDNCAKYGLLYSAETMLNGEVCPTGWHVPNDAEWKTITSIPASQLKAASDWGTVGTDESGFSLLPAGYRNSTGTYASLGQSALIWSSNTKFGTGTTMQKYLLLNNENSYSGITSYEPSAGTSSWYSIRCVKDAE
jgi:uncharacterized protein (TIGR02145 family)